MIHVAELVHLLTGPHTLVAEYGSSISCMKRFNAYYLYFRVLIAEKDYSAL